MSWILLPLLLTDNIWRKTSNDVKITDNTNYIPICAIKEGIAIGLCVACVLSVLMIGIDQYFAVIDPLRYHSAITTTTSVIMIVVSWTIAGMFGVFGSLSINRNCTWYDCELLNNERIPILPKVYQIVFSVVFLLFVFVIPFVSICWIYVSICSAAHENNQRTKRNGSTTNFGVQEAALLDFTIVATIHESVEFDPNENRKIQQDLPKPLHHSSTKSSLKSTSSSIVNSLRHRISNASMFRYREETRAARISVLVIVMALFCWLPFTLMLLIRSSLLNSIDIPQCVKQIGILSLSSNAVVSPLIFAHRNRRIHRELCKLFRASKRRSSFYDNLKVRRSHSCKKRAVTSVDVKNKEMLMALTSDEGCVMMKSPKKCVSILNRVWNMTKESEKIQNSLRLPEIALETDTSRSSFSSNGSSSGSNLRSTSAASFSDAIEEI
ncbi:hypothetical protein PGB90_004494 [Kerria lacca]